MEGDKGLDRTRSQKTESANIARPLDFTLEKSIFSHVFQKDIRYVYLYRKIERLSKAVYLVLPAFDSRPALKERLELIGVDLIDAAVLTPTESAHALSRELLLLTSLLAVARTTGILSPMNADLISKEAILLLSEVAAYQQPRLFLEEAPTLAELAKHSPDLRELGIPPFMPSAYDFADELTPEPAPVLRRAPAPPKGHIKDKTPVSSRQEAILEVLRSKGPSYIKDISTIIREVSEKTIQRELQVLVQNGRVHREGERRWTRYTVV